MAQVRKAWAREKKRLRYLFDVTKKRKKARNAYCHVM